MPNMFIKTLSMSSNGLEVEADLASPAVSITGMNVHETEGSTDINITTTMKNVIVAQVLVKKSISVPLSPSAMQGPRAIRVSVDGVLDETLRV